MAHKHPHDHGPNKPLGGGVTKAAHDKVRTPAIAMLVVGALYLLVAIIATIYTANPAAFNTMIVTKQEQSQKAGKPEPNFITTTFQNIVDLNSPLVIAGQVLISIIVLLGGTKMLRLSSIGWTRIGAMAAMIPCLSPVCVLAMPVGVWCLIVSLNDDVKEGFRRGPGVGPPRTDK